MKASALVIFQGRDGYGWTRASGFLIAIMERLGIPCATGGVPSM